jgi:short-subunit dehydrogenase
MRSLTDAVVVITGASRGIGAAMARQFAAEKAKLVLAARGKEQLAETGKSLKLPKDKLVTVTADVCKRAGMKRIVETGYKKFGRIDVFINNAGIGVSGPVTELAEKDYDLMFDTNLKSVYFCFRELLPLYEKQGGGQIINVSSMAGRHGVPNLAAYAATKAALNVFSESVAGEVRNDNIKVSVLAPGSTDTSFGSGSRRRSGRSSTGKKMLTAQEVAEAAVFLARQNENAWSSMVDIRPLVIKR